MVAGMDYSPMFFELQLRLARRVVALAAIPLEQALLEYTHLFIRLGCGRRPDGANARWREFLAGLKSHRDAVAWTCEFRRRAAAWDTGPSVERSRGCFAYSRIAPDQVRLHFHTDPAAPVSALAASQAPARRQELAALLASLCRAGPATRVTGGSWLYGIEAYRRLFPPAYLASARPVPPPWQRLPLWGQLLDRHGQVRPPAQARLLKGLEAAASIADLDRCFAFPVLALEAPVGVFSQW